MKVNISELEKGNGESYMLHGSLDTVEAPVSDHLGLSFEVGCDWNGYSKIW